jgi:cell division septum initiation protein DivIVA
MSSYLSVDEIYEENKVLKEKIIELENQIKKLKTINKNLTQVIDMRNQENAVEILECFHDCSSIRNTAWKFGIDMEELFELIPEWDGCRDGLQSADDYNECRLEVVGRKECDEEEEDDMEPEELKKRMRTPESDEITKIIADYKESNLGMYELADRYDLKINNLFRLLKENGVIEKETDAKCYESFYIDHLGAGSEWDGKSEFGLIATFYEETESK